MGEWQDREKDSPLVEGLAAGLEAVRAAGGSDTADAAGMGRVLLVEDHPAHILLGTTYLEQFGYQADVAAGGIEAVEKASHNDYLAVLMDVEMQDISGIEATRLIRAQEAKDHRRPVAIIGMTAHALPSDRRRCLEAGMNDYLSKPFDPEALRQKLAQRRQQISGQAAQQPRQMG